MNERSQAPYILHADGDSFFVACELTKRPDLVGKPVIVGEDRGIAAAMSYEAKKMGVTRAMSVFEIKRLYPEVVILNHSFALYREISDKMYEIISSYLDVVQRYSIDECFAEVSHADIRFYGGLEKLAHTIQDDIRHQLGVTYSFGIGRTKSLAKIASKMRKPNGCVVIETEVQEIEALKKTPIDDVWGLGRRTSPRLINMGIHTAHTFTQYSSTTIARFFSEPVVDIQQELLGNRRLHVEGSHDPRDQKSLQSTSTFRPSSNIPSVIWSELAENIEHACRRARKLGLQTKQISFFVKSREFVYRTADVRLSHYTSEPGAILNAIEQAFAEILIEGEMIRATGITLQSLVKVEHVQDDLFGLQRDSQKVVDVELAVDGMRKKYGNGAVRRVSSLRAKTHTDFDAFHPRAQI